MSVEYKSLKDIIGLRVHCLRGEKLKDKRTKSKPENTEVAYILLDDHKTYIELSEQDYYDYHDCDPSAKLLAVKEDSNRWNEITAHYPISLCDDKVY
jgi:hypothetical protein